MVNRIVASANASEQSKLLTVAETAERLRCSRALVYQLCESGKLPHHRLGLGRGTIRVSQTDIELFLEQSRVKAPPPQPRLPMKHLRL
jgi:excisionase family DNA binding protein